MQIVTLKDLCETDTCFFSLEPRGVCVLGSQTQLYNTSAPSWPPKITRTEGFFSACHRCLASGLSPTFQAKTAAKALQNDPESFAASVCLPAFVQRCGDLWCVSDAYIFSVTVIEFSQFCQPFPEEKLTCHSHLKSLRVLELNFHLQSLNLTPPLHGFVHASTLLRCFLPLWR